MSEVYARGEIRYMGLNLKKRVSKHGGLKGSIQYAFQKLSGLERVQEEIKTLQYLVNEHIDITTFPKTKDPDLRIMQDGLLLLIKIFDKLCTKKDLTYWLSSGTALGAERHHGFIPWDDDLDVCMPREDYDKVIPLLKEELAPFGIEVRWGGYFDNRGYLSRLALAYKTIKTGIWMDIFPADLVNISLPLAEARPVLNKAIDEYRNYYFSVENKVDNSIILKKKEAIFASYSEIGKGENRIYIEAPEFGDGHRYMLENDVYPVKRVDFEDIQLPVYHNNRAYLIQCYGENYMSFPKRGVLDHVDPDGQHAKTRAKRHGVDMKEVIEHLTNVYNAI